MAPCRCFEGDRPGILVRFGLPLALSVGLGIAAVAQDLA
jgi:hypothetical protein